MEFSIPNAPAVGLTQQMGEGYAQVLDTSTFDPITFLTNYNKKREDEIKAQAKQDMQRKAKWKAYQIPVPTDIFESNNAEIESAIDEWGVVMQDAMASGVDPDSPEFYKDFAKYKAKVNEAAAEGKALETMVKGYYDKVKQNPEKYDPEKFQEWVNGLKEQPNLKARKEYVATTNPLAEKFDFAALVPDLIPPSDVYESASGVTVTKTDRKKLKQNIENSLALAKLDPQKAEYIQQGFEKGVDDGLWKDVDGMVDWYTNYGMNLGGESQLRRESGGGMSINFGSGGANYGDVVVTDIYEKTDGNLAEGLNGVAISKDGKDAPPVSVQFDNGTMEAFVPIRFYKTKEGFWRVEGKRGRSGSTYKTFEEANNAKGAGGIVQKTADGQYEVVTISSETVSIPYSETNKKILKGHLNGFDVVEYEAKKGEGAPAKKDVVVDDFEEFVRK